MIKLSIALYALIVGSAAWSAVSATTIMPLHIGSGGQLTSLDVQCDVSCAGGTGTATKVVRTDTYGAWYYNPTKTDCGNAKRTGCWQQLVTPSSFPKSVVTYGREGAGAAGVYEIVIAPSNTSRFYMYYGGDGCIYTSSDRGARWTKTGFVCAAANPNSSNKFFGPFMAVDPANEQIAYASTPASGTFVTTNGGTAWTRVAAVGVGSSAGLPQGGGSLIAFDPRAKVVAKSTQGIYISTYGIGVFHSQDGGRTWHLTSGSPTTHRHMVVDPTGRVWLTDNTNNAANVHTYDGGNWKSIAEAGGFFTIAVDRNNCVSATTCHVVLADNGGVIDVTTNGGASWTGKDYGYSRVATDIPWLANTQETYMTNGNMMFDPSNSNTLDFAEGIGFWETNPPTSSATRFQWTSVSADIEQLVSHWAISPPKGDPVLTFWDRPVFVSKDPAIYPSNHGANYNQSIMMGWSVDYASNDPKTLVLLANWAGKDSSGISKDGGDKWSPFPSLPTDIFPAGPSGPMGFLGGSIAASTSRNFLISLSDDGNLWYTKDAGASWHVTGPPGIPRSATAIADEITPAGGVKINFASVPSSVAVGQLVSDISGYQVSDAKVIAKTASTVTISAPATRQVNSGDAFIFQAETGWNHAYYLNRQNICADRVRPHTFYAYNYGPSAAPNAAGIWRSSDGGASWVKEGYFNTGFPNSTFNARLECVPGSAGDMYFSSGSQNGPHPNDQGFYECLDKSQMLSCRKFFNVKDVWAFGFGAPALHDAAYPTIYLYGAVNNTMGYWRSTDHGASWLKIGAAFDGTLDTPTVVIGDSNIFGRAYVGFSGSGFAYIQSGN